MEDYLYKIVQVSLGHTPEEMLETSLDVCIEISGATGGSILGEEGPYLQFLFSDVEDLIGVQVPFDSIAGVSVNKNRVVYTYAPSDKRHFTGVDEKIKHQTNYLLSVPIPSIHRSSGEDRQGKNAGALQLLFDENIMPGADVENGPKEFNVEEFKKTKFYSESLRNIFWILPMIAFGMEVMKLRQTSYQVIHELKNKMISGLSWVGYLKDDIKNKNPEILEDEDIKEDFDLSESSIKEGAELAKTYLQFTKIYEPHFEETNISSVLNETAASVKALASEMKAQDFDVELDVSDEIKPRSLDPGQLKMAFYNLCKNGVEALVEYSVKNPRISITAAPNDDRIEVRVTDNGPGMPKEIADNLFIPFKTKKEGGTGLGLTITKKIIDVHGGTISCETSENGTSFIMRI